MSTPQRGGPSSGPTPSRILAATDLSEPGAGAIRQASAQALAVNGTLGVCHVLPSLGVHMLFPQRYARKPTTLRYAAERHSEWVVLRTRGHTGLARVALGSVAEHVMRLATTTVLVVRPNRAALTS